MTKELEEHIVTLSENGLEYLNGKTIDTIALNPKFDYEVIMCEETGEPVLLPLTKDDKPCKVCGNKYSDEQFCSHCEDKKIVPFELAS